MCIRDSTISEFGAFVREKGIPQQMEVGLVGSCTNSSYQDMGRAASVARQAKTKDLKVKAEFIINPGSEQVRYTAERDGILGDLTAIGGVIMANACGPCICLLYTSNPEERNKVTLMTVHSAKGLEFEYVYVAGLEENLFPSMMSMGCLLYTSRCV